MRLLIDTNVLPELRRPERAHPRVLGWAEKEDQDDWHLSVISVLEIEHGARFWPAATSVRAVR